jgi:2-(1,2-epoxy-1,2-dihydrophenyl)acetyl-CoA isomerase
MLPSDGTRRTMRCIARIRSSRMSDVLFEKRPDGVGLITLNRPESLNAMGGDLLPLLARYLEECERDREIRCVALTGAGRAFCAGGDVRAMQSRNTSVASESGGANLMSVLNQLADELRRSHNATSLRLHTMGKPTVALVNGHAVGAGFSLALACDIRIASENAKFGTAFRNVGLSGDYGGSYFLQRLVGAGRARELYFTAEILGAQRALELGIVNQVIPHADLLPAGLAFCAKLASGPTASYGRMKKNLDLGATGTLQQVLDQEALLMRISGLSRDSREAVAAFLEKREPKFAGE